MTIIYVALKRSMKLIGLSVLCVVVTSLAAAQYKPVDQGSTVEFKIKNFGFNTSGSFTGLQGMIKFDIRQLNEASFDVSIDAATVNTGIEMRDHHLRGTDYFDSKNYPRIRFVSTKVSSSPKAGTFLISGKLTIKNHTMDTSFPFTATQTIEGYVFQGVFTINRKDFAIGGSSVISDKLDVDLSILAKK